MSYSRGTVLLNSITKKWSRETWEEAYKEERRIVYWNLGPRGEWRSGRFICTCADAETAAKVVTALNHYTKCEYKND